VTDVLLDLPSHLRDRLASAFESGVLAGSPSVASLTSVMGHSDDADGIVVALHELGRLGVNGRAVAAWLRAVARAAARAPKPDLVWSGPEVPGLYARSTRAVYEDLLGCAERSIWATPFSTDRRHLTFLLDEWMLDLSCV
jgi:hypothetical protein